MTYEKSSMKELNKCLQNNLDAQTEINHKIHQIESLSEETLFDIALDSRSAEKISSGWTGQDVEAYILQTREENENFRRRYVKAFSDEQQRLREKLKALEEDENEVRYAIRNYRETKEK